MGQRVRRHHNTMPTWLQGTIPNSLVQFPLPSSHRVIVAQEKLFQFVEPIAKITSLVSDGIWRWCCNNDNHCRQRRVTNWALYHHDNVCFVLLFLVFFVFVFFFMTKWLFPDFTLNTLSSFRNPNDCSTWLTAQTQRSVKRTLRVSLFTLSN